MKSRKFYEYSLIFCVVFFIEGGVFLEAIDTRKVLVSTLSQRSSFLNRDEKKTSVATKRKKSFDSEEMQPSKKQQKISFDSQYSFLNMIESLEQNEEISFDSQDSFLNMIESLEQMEQNEEMSFELLKLCREFIGNEHDKLHLLEKEFSIKKKSSKWASYDSKDIDGKILFEIALEWKERNFMLLLIKNGVMPDRDNEEVKNLIFYAIEKFLDYPTEESLGYFECLIDRGWDLNFNTIRQSDQKKESFFFIDSLNPYTSLPQSKQELLEKMLKKCTTYFINRRTDLNHPDATAGRAFLFSLMQMIRNLSYGPLETDTIEFFNCLVGVVYFFINQGSESNCLGVAEKTHCLFFLTQAPTEEMKNGRFPSSRKVESFFSLIKFFIDEGAEIQNDSGTNERTILFDLIELIDFFERGRVFLSVPYPQNSDLFHLINLAIIKGASVNALRKSDGRTPFVLLLEKIDVFYELCSDEYYFSNTNTERFFALIQQFINHRANVNHIRVSDGATPFLIFMEKMQKCAVLFFEESKKRLHSFSFNHEDEDQDLEIFSDFLNKISFQIELFLRNGLDLEAGHISDQKTNFSCLMESLEKFSDLNYSQKKIDQAFWSLFCEINFCIEKGLDPSDLVLSDYQRFFKLLQLFQSRQFISLTEQQCYAFKNIFKFFLQGFLDPKNPISSKRVEVFFLLPNIVKKFRMNNFPESNVQEIFLVLFDWIKGFLETETEVDVNYVRYSDKRSLFLNFLEIESYAHISEIDRKFEIITLFIEKGVDLNYVPQIGGESAFLIFLQSLRFNQYRSSENIEELKIIKIFIDKIIAMKPIRPFDRDRLFLKFVKFIPFLNPKERDPLETFKPLIQIFRKGGVPINYTRSSNKETPLMVLLESLMESVRKNPARGVDFRYLELILFFLENGARGNEARLSDGKTPFLSFIQLIPNIHANYNISKSDTEMEIYTKKRNLYEKMHKTLFAVLDRFIRNEVDINYAGYRSRGEIVRYNKAVNGTTPLIHFFEFLLYDPFADNEDSSSEENEDSSSEENEDSFSEEIESQYIPIEISSVVNYFFEKGANLHYIRDSDGMTPFFAFIESLSNPCMCPRDHWKIVNQFIDAKVDLNYVRKIDKKNIIYCFFGMLEKFWNSSIAPAPFSFDEYMNSFFEMLKFFVEKGANPNYVEPTEERIALFSLIRNMTEMREFSGYFDLIKFFVKRADDINYVEGLRKTTALFFMLHSLYEFSQSGVQVPERMKERFIDLIKFFLKEGADLNFISVSPESDLYSTPLIFLMEKNRRLFLSREVSQDFFKCIEAIFTETVPQNEDILEDANQDIDNGINYIKNSLKLSVKEIEENGTDREMPVEKICTCEKKVPMLLILSDEDKAFFVNKRYNITFPYKITILENRERIFMRVLITDFQNLLSREQIQQNFVSGDQLEETSSSLQELSFMKLMFPTEDGKKPDFFQRPYFVPFEIMQKFFRNVDSKDLALIKEIKGKLKNFIVQNSSLSKEKDLVSIPDLINFIQNKIYDHQGEAIFTNLLYIFETIKNINSYYIKYEEVELLFTKTIKKMEGESVFGRQFCEGSVNFFKKFNPFPLSEAENSIKNTKFHSYRLLSNTLYRLESQIRWKKLQEDDRNPRKLEKELLEQWQKLVEIFFVDKSCRLHSWKIQDMKECSHSENEITCREREAKNQRRLSPQNLSEFEISGELRSREKIENRLFEECKKAILSENIDDFQLFFRDEFLEDDRAAALKYVSIENNSRVISEFLSEKSAVFSQKNRIREASVVSHSA